MVKLPRIGKEAVIDNDIHVKMANIKKRSRLQQQDLDRKQPGGVSSEVQAAHGQLDGGTDVASGGAGGVLDEGQNEEP